MAGYAWREPAVSAASAVISESIITRCPACLTAFRATPSQLSAHGGLVRCGHCNEVFNAPQHALASGSPEPIDSNHAVPGTGIVPEDHNDASPSEAQADLAPSGEDALATQDQAAVPAPVTPEYGAADDEPPVGQSIVLDRLEPAKTAGKDRQTPLPASQEFDFGRPAPSRQLKPGLLLFMVLLTGLLLLQAAHRFRGDLILLFPAARPAIETACVWLECSMPLPRRADLMSIESSDLQGDAFNSQMMVLSATLRNRAPFAQSAPALELTLTDGQDQPLARRVLEAPEYLGEPAVNSGRAEAPPQVSPGAEIPVKVYFEAVGVQPTGYRLYLFYP